VGPLVAEALNRAASDVDLGLQHLTAAVPVR
jgi:hypothetical protein